jgi:protein-L-isoaspartate(D-aspartate) O-methyltransferase
MNKGNTFESQKERLFEELKQEGIEAGIIEAMKRVDRRVFIPEPYKGDAYLNYPQPIGEGQTISQPYTVAYMIQLLSLEEGNKVLEVGAGSGYNAAIMAELIGESGKIISIEIVPNLVERARHNLSKAGIENIEVIQGSGRDGFPEDAPYDRIIVTAGATEIPDPLLEQLDYEGIMVIPVSVDGYQVMTRVLKTESLEITRHGHFRFVPFM